MKLQRKKLTLAVLGALNAGVVASLAAPFAYAQQATPPAEPQRLERIDVTGSRIPSPTLTSESPVNVISAQDIAYTGLTNTSDIVNQLPQAYAEQGNNLANAATGTSTVNLRNLGSARTLVLIDGKRVPAGDPFAWAADLNAIPAPLIQRVEVLSGGASSIYGSDAIAGVVNFIMNDHFEGIQLQWNANGYNHQQHNDVSSIVAERALTNPSQFSVPGDVGLDGQTQDFSLTMGSNFANGKGNATVYFGYRKTDAVLQGSRDFSACSLGASAAGFNCGGSGTGYPGQFTDFSNYAITIANAAGGVRPYASATDTFNFGPYNHYQRPDERYMANAFAHYDAFPNVRVYAEFDFMADSTITQIAPSGTFFNSYVLRDNNPLLSQAFKDAAGITATTPQTVYIGRRNIEGGGRQQDLAHTNYRYVLGAKGDILDGKWDYNFWWQSGKNLYAQTYLNDFNTARLTNALDVIADPGTGLPVCASGAAGCIPYDIFRLGGVTQAALDYVQTPGFQSGFTSQSVVGLNVTSDLGTAYGWKLPWARNGVGVAFGIERRVEKLSLATDSFFSVPEGAGQGGATIGLSGQYTVVEPYAEIRLPLVERQPWAYDLTLTGAYRYSNYSTDHTTNSYGIGADWAPVKEAKLRGSYQQAVRAANIIELFTAQGFNLFDMSDDPCGKTGSATLEQCLRTGLLASQYQTGALTSPAGQYNFIQGGNPDLKPETAKTYTVGVVLQPLPNLSATIDYWNIKVEDTIGIISSPLALNQCLTNGTFCDLIHRGPNGNLWLPDQGFVTGLNQNLGSQETDGVDVTLSWSQPITHYGSVAVNFVGTWVNQFITEPVKDLGKYDCVGLYGPTCGAPQPAWRSRVQGIWNTPWNVNLALTWRYIGAADVEFTSSNPQLTATVPSVGASLGSQNYFDLALQWNIDKNWTVRGGANNLFDRDPPLVQSGLNPLPYGNGNTWPGVYDTLGRNFFVSVTAKY